MSVGWTRLTHRICGYYLCLSFPLVAGLLAIAGWQFSPSSPWGPWALITWGLGAWLSGGALVWWFSGQLAAQLQRIHRGLMAVNQGQLDQDFSTPFPVAEIQAIATGLNHLIREINLLNEEMDQKLTQLEIAEITAQQSCLELAQEKEKVEATTQKLSAANAQITRLNERLQDENLGLASELQQVNDRLSQFLDAMPVGVVVLDQDRHIFYSNQRAKQLFHNPHPCAAHQSFVPYLIRKTPQAKPQAFSQVIGLRALTQGESASFDDLEICHPQNPIPIETWETPIFDHQGQIIYAIVACQDITDRKQSEREKRQFTEELLKLNQANQRFVPQQFIQLLGKSTIMDVDIGDNVQKKMSVLFSDIRGFTGLSETMSPKQNFEFINGFLSRMTPAINENNGFIDKYIGDAIMALFNDADSALRASISMLQRLQEYNLTRTRPDRPPLAIGIGINTGIMRLGTVGSHNHMEGTVISDSVNLAARLEKVTKIYGTPLLITHHTFKELQDSNDYQLRIVDHIKVKGKMEEVTVFEVFDADPLEIREKKLATRLEFEQGLIAYNLFLWRDAAEIFQGCLEVLPSDQVAQIYLQRCQLNSESDRTHYFSPGH